MVAIIKSDCNGTDYQIWESRVRGPGEFRTGAPSAAAYR
jgi:hypothetical protein